MKRFLSVLLTVLMCFFIIGCESDDTTSSAIFSQEVTIVRMPSPPKCKTSNNISDVNKIIDILGEIKKTPATCGNSNGWSIMIKLNVDGQMFDYTIACDTFTDSDGKQYCIKNFDDIEEKIINLYNDMDSPESNYE